MFNYYKTLGEKKSQLCSLLEKAPKVDPIINILIKKYRFLSFPKNYLNARDILYYLMYNKRRAKSKSDRKVDRTYVPEDFVLIPRSPKAFSQPEKYVNKYFADVMEQAPYLSCTRSKNVISLLESLNMVYVRIGQMGDYSVVDPTMYDSTIKVNGKTTEVVLKPMDEWDWPCIADNGEDALKIMMVYRSLSISHRDKTPEEIEAHEFKKEHQAVIKDKRYLWDATLSRDADEEKRKKFLPKFLIPASEAKRNEIKKINNYLIEKDLEELCYTRVYNNNEYNYGRISSLFNRIDKKHRKILETYYDYVELDFSSFNSNLLSLWLQNEKFKHDSYESGSKGLFDYVDIPPEHDTEENRKTYREVFKCFSLTFTGARGITEAKAACRQSFLRPYVKDKRTGEYIENKKSPGLWNDQTYFPYPYKHEKDLLIREGKLNGSDTNIKDYKANIRWRNWLKEHNRPLDTPLIRINEEDLIVIINKAMPEISSLLFTDVNSFCQNVESNTTVRVGSEMVDEDILPLTVHDAYIVPREYAEYFNSRKEEILLEEYKKVKIPKYKETVLYKEAAYEYHSIEQIIRGLITDKALKKYKSKIVKEAKRLLSDRAIKKTKYNFLIRNLVKTKIKNATKDFAFLIDQSVKEFKEAKQESLKAFTDDRMGETFKESMRHPLIKKVKLFQKREYIKSFGEIDTVSLFNRFFKSLREFLYFDKASRRRNISLIPKNFLFKKKVKKRENKNRKFFKSNNKFKNFYYKYFKKFKNSYFIKLLIILLKTSSVFIRYYNGEAFNPLIIYPLRE